MRILCLLLLSAAAMAQAPVWVKVANEPQVVSSAASVTYHYGTATGTTTDGRKCPCWSPPVTATLTNATVSNANGNSFFWPDPAPGVQKQLEVQQTGVVQTLTVDGATVTVPAGTPVTPPASKTLLVTCTTKVTIILATDQVTTSGSTCSAIAQ